MNRINIRKFFWLAFAIFILCLIIGMIQAIRNPESAKQSLGNFNIGLNVLDNKPNYLVLIGLFLHNAIQSLFSIFLFFLFGLFALTGLITNGISLGQTAVLWTGSHGLLWFIAAVFPHGLFEFTAIILSSGLGMWLGYLFYRKIFKKEHAQFKEGVKKVLIFYVKFILPLYLLAAIVEVYITPYIANFK